MKKKGQQQCGDKCGKTPIPGVILFVTRHATFLYRNFVKEIEADLIGTYHLLRYLDSVIRIVEKMRSSKVTENRVHIVF